MMKPDKESPKDSGAGARTREESLSRRQFLRGLGIGAGVLATGFAPAVVSALPKDAPEAGAEIGPEPAVHEDGAINYPGKPVSYADPAIEGVRYGMVIDIKACVGCRQCVYACMKENNIGRNSGFTYIKVLEMEAGTLELEHAKLDYEEGGKPDRYYVPVQCMQCEKPPCVYGCPVKATWREPDGIVVIDYDKCIACRNCMVTCPYFARHFNWVEPHVPKNEVNPEVPLHEKAGVVEKCTFCVQRTRNGLTTRCTEVCPVGARKFGDLNDPESEVSQILRTRRAFRLKEEMGTEPVIWYVG